MTGVFWVYLLPVVFQYLSVQAISFCTHYQAECQYQIGTARFVILTLILDSSLGPLDPEDEGSSVVQKVEPYWLSDTASHPEDLTLQMIILNFVTGEQLRNLLRGLHYSTCFHSCNKAAVYLQSVMSLSVPLSLLLLPRASAVKSVEV
jgi:hypothetical protein